MTEHTSTPRANRALVSALRESLRAEADPDRAPAMEAYMKSAMPYYGVSSPVQRRVFRAVFAAHPLEGFAAWADTLLAIWRGATHREERYGAIALAGDRRYAAHRVRAVMPVFEEFIVTGAWWDYVDPTAQHVGDVLRVDRAWTTAEVRAWSRSEVMWKRRASIICQLRFKAGTDLDLLYDCIEANLGDREFFIRKAIGWALRQYAWTDPDEVTRYVRTHRERLSPLSKREALKNVIRSGRLEAIP